VLDASNVIAALENFAPCSEAVIKQKQQWKDMKIAKVN